MILTHDHAPHPRAVADGLYAMLVALQLPADAVLHDGRREREPAMLAHLLAAGDDPELLQLDNTAQVPEVRRCATRLCRTSDAPISPNPSASGTAHACSRLHTPPLVQMALEIPADDKFVDFTTLSGTLLDYHSLLGMLRTIAALIAWVITCREDTTLLITVPPLPREG